MHRFSFYYITIGHILLLLTLLASTLNAQFLSCVKFLPKETFFQVFPADEIAHRMKIGNIVGKKDMLASLGGVISVAQTADKKLLLSSAASVQFGVHPAGQAQIVSMEFYVDYLILEADLPRDFYFRTLLGHTSHHLSDTEYEKLKLTQSVNYSRDYAAAYAIYSNAEKKLFYAGSNFGYVFHLVGKEKKRWQFHFGGEQVIKRWSNVQAYLAADSKWFQEAGFQFANIYQAGLKFPNGGLQAVRAAYQFRHGLDMRGQFYPRHRSEHAVVLMIDM